PGSHEPGARGAPALGGGDLRPQPEAQRRMRLRPLPRLQLAAEAPAFPALRTRALLAQAARARGREEALVPAPSMVLARSVAPVVFAQHPASWHMLLAPILPLAR